MLHRYNSYEFRTFSISYFPFSWTQTDMDRAILDVTVNGLSIRKAATKYQIPKSSLADQLTRHKCMKGKICVTSDNVHNALVKVPFPSSSFFSPLFRRSSFPFMLNNTLPNLATVRPSGVVHSTSSIVHCMGTLGRREWCCIV